MILTLDQVRKLLSGNSDYEAWHSVMCILLPKYEINTPSRIAGFVAQCGHESLNFKVLEENLNYSADGLNKIFPKYFERAGRDAKNYHRKPEAIANVVYSSRMGNAGESSGDGWKFRGRGVIQLTGKHNYEAFGSDIGKYLDEVVEYLGTKMGALESACWYWNSRNINSAADVGDIVKMTKLVNGGTIGLEDRKHHYERALNILDGNGYIDSTPEPEAIRIGSTGDTVKKVQKKLGLDADGIFGKVTQQYVMEWQINNGLTPDGIVGPKTLAKMLI
jgi:putative chitinase